MSTPSAGTDATTKTYVDAKISGGVTGAPIPTASAGVGQVVRVYAGNSGGGYTLPAGGTWFVVLFSVCTIGSFEGCVIDRTTQYINRIGIYSGGTVMTPAIASAGWAGFAWRIS
jgi:hypothetical protein